MKSLPVLLLFTLLLLAEVQRSHHSVVTIADESVFRDCTVQGEPNVIFGQAYPNDILALANIDSERVKKAIPHLTSVSTSSKDNGLGPIFNYFLELCNDQANVRKLSRDAKNIFNFAYYLGAAKRPSTDPDRILHSFFATEIRTNNENEVKSFFGEIEEQERKDQEEDERIEAEKKEEEAKRQEKMNKKNSGDQKQPPSKSAKKKKKNQPA